MRRAAVPEWKKAAERAPPKAEQRGRHAERLRAEHRHPVGSERQALQQVASPVGEAGSAQQMAERPGHRAEQRRAAYRRLAWWESLAPQRAALRSGGMASGQPRVERPDRHAERPKEALRPAAREAEAPRAGP